MKKIITYCLTLSKVFPATHPKAGQDTGFKQKLFAAKNNMPCYHPKIHTIRANYSFWRKRFEKIEAGEAVLSIRQWVGKPYGKGSIQIEIMRLTREDGIGLQRLEFDKDRNGSISYNFYNIDGHFPGLIQLAGNDGLSVEDWKTWFKGCDFSKPLAVIHFTPFRY